MSKNQYQYCEKGGAERDRSVICQQRRMMQNPIAKQIEAKRRMK